MATTEQFLISLGIDPASIKGIVKDYEALKNGIEGDPINLSIEVANAAGQIRDVGVEAQAAFRNADQEAAIFEDGIMDITEGLGELKTTLVAVAGAAALISGLGFLQAAEESKSLARANVILRDSTEDLAKKQADLRLIADETGLTYAEVAAALFDVASAGFEGEEAVDAIRAAAQAAVPAGIDLATAFNAIATAQNNFGITSEEAADKLVKIADVTRGTLANVSQALGRIAPTASSVGISLDEVGAAFASITNKGESAEEASTLLFNAINKFLAPSKEAAKILSQLGVETGDAAFHTQTLTDKLEIVARAAATGSAELSKVFDIRAGRAIRAITSDMDGFRENLTKIADSAGRTKQGLTDFISSAGPQFEKFKTQVINVATAIGTDLLGVVVPLTTAFGNFITENRELITILTELALVVGGLAGAWLLYVVAVKQVQAAGKVISGISKAISIYMTSETSVLGTNIAAWWARVAVQGKAAKTKLAKVIGAVVKLLKTENATIWLGIKAWGVRLGLGIVKTLDAIGSALVFVVQWVRRETAALWANTTVVNVNGQAVLTLRGRLNALVFAFRQNVGAAGAFTTALGVLGAAVVGAQIGSWINDWLELEDATARYTKGVGSSTDAIKANISTLGFAAVFARTAAIRTEELTRLTAQQAKILDEDSTAMAKFTTFTKLGLSTQVAYSAALGNATAELGAFQELQRSGANLTDAQVARMTALKAILEAQAKSRAESLRTSRSQAEASQKAGETLIRVQDEWTAAIAKTDKAYRELKRGAFAQTDVDLRTFDAAVKLTTEVLRSQAVEIGDIQKEREKVLMEGKDDFLREFTELTAALELKQADFATTLEKLNRDIVLINAKIIANGRQFISDLKAQADRQVADRKAAVADLIKADQKLLTETKKTLAELIKARDKAVSSVERFSQRLEDAAIRRADPRLLEIIKLEREFAAIMKQGIPTLEERNRAVENLGTELTRLSAATTEEIRLQEELAEAREDIAEARTSDDADAADQLSDALEEQTKIEERLAQISAARQERTAKAETVIADAIAKSTEAIKTFADREAEITAIEAKRELAQARLKIIADSIETAQAAIRDRMREQVAEAKKLIQAQLAAVAGAIELAKIATSEQGALSPAAFETRLKATGDKLTQAFEGLRELAAEDIGASIEEASKTVNSIGGLNADAAKFLTEVTAKMKVAEADIVARNEVIVPAAAQVVETMADLPMHLVSSTDALGAMVGVTNVFAEGLDEFADTTVNGFEKIADRLDATTRRIILAEDQIRNLSGVGGGANGLPK